MTMTDTTAVRSADGTRIAYFRSGTGTAIILIDPALSTHKGSTKLSAALAAALLGDQLRPPGPRCERRRAAEHRRSGARDRRHRGARRRRRRAAHPLRVVLGGRARARGGRQAGRPRERRRAVRAAVHLRRQPPAAGTGPGGADRGIRRRGRSLGRGQGLLHRGDRDARRRGRRDADAAAVARGEDADSDAALRLRGARRERRTDVRCRPSAGAACVRRHSCWSAPRVRRSSTPRVRRWPTRCRPSSTSRSRAPTTARRSCRPRRSRRGSPIGSQAEEDVVGIESHCRRD